MSLERPVGDDGESEFGHFIEDENAPLPDEAADTSFRDEALTKCLSSLSYRERRVLELRFGLNGEQPRSLDEVGRVPGQPRADSADREPVAEEAAGARRVAEPPRRRLIVSGPRAWTTAL